LGERPGGHAKAPCHIQANTFLANAGDNNRLNDWEWQVKWAQEERYLTQPNP